MECFSFPRVAEVASCDLFDPGLSVLRPCRGSLRNAGSSPRLFFSVASEVHE